MANLINKVLKISAPISGDKLMANSIRADGKAAGMSEGDIETTIYALILIKYSSYLGALYWGGKALF